MKMLMANTQSKCIPYAEDCHRLTNTNAAVATGGAGQRGGRKGCAPCPAPAPAPVPSALPAGSGTCGPRAPRAAVPVPPCTPRAGQSWSTLRSPEEPRGALTLSPLRRAEHCPRKAIGSRIHQRGRGMTAINPSCESSPQEHEVQGNDLRIIHRNPARTQNAWWKPKGN